MGIKAIFCDVNGVLFKEEERFSIRYSREFDIPIDLLNSYLDNDFDLCLTGKEDLKNVLPRLLELWKWKGSVEELLSYWFGNDVKTREKFLNFINELHLKNLQIFISTQNEKYRTTKSIEILKPFLNFDMLIATYIVGFKKSNIEYFKSVLMQFNLKPEEVIMIDNSSKVINLAKSYGLRTVLFESEDQAISEIRKILELNS